MLPTAGRCYYRLIRPHFPSGAADYRRRCLRYRNDARRASINIFCVRSIPLHKGRALLIRTADRIATARISSKRIGLPSMTTSTFPVNGFIVFHSSTTLWIREHAVCIR